MLSYLSQGKTEKREVFSHSILSERNVFAATDCLSQEGRKKKKTTHHVTLFQLPQALFCLKPSLTLTPSVIRAICHRRAGNHFLPSHGHLNINAVGTMELYHTNLLIPFIFHFTATFVSIHRSNSVLFCLAQKY